MVLLEGRQAVISLSSLLKKRPKPNSPEHDSIGTESTLQKRRETREKLKALTVSSKQLEPHLMSAETMKRWGFMTELPDGPGGSNPSEEGKVKTCERCNKPFVVKRKEEADVCMYHWGRARMNKVGGRHLSSLLDSCLYPVCRREVEDLDLLLRGFWRLGRMRQRASCLLRVGARRPASSASVHFYSSSDCRRTGRHGP